MSHSHGTKREAQESEGLDLPSDTNTGASHTPGPNIVISDADNGQSPKTPFDSTKPQSSEGPSLKGRDSFRLEDSTVDSDDPAHGIAFPSTIPFSIFFCFKSGSKIFQDCAAKDQILHYNDPKSYPEFQEKARAYISQHHRYTEALGTKDLYYQIGKCSILGENGYKETYALTSRGDWIDICMALINLWTKKNLRTLKLEIFQNFFTLQTQVISGQPFVDTIKGEIHNLMEFSDNGQYMPRTALNVITSSSIVRRIIFEDTNLSMELDEKELFVEMVVRDARRVFLMFVDAGLSMSCLKKLLDQKFCDAKLPMKHPCSCHTQCQSRFRALINGQSNFMAAEFLDIGEHQKFSSCVVVPISYKDMTTHDSSPAEEDPNSVSTDSDNDDDAKKKRRALCGKGAYSNVYCVNINPDHHRLSKDRDADFAVKEFKDMPQRDNLDFNKESKFMDELYPYPEEHIITLLATWTQKGRYYMLFPYAECNLRQYMERVSYGEPDNENMLWLLMQFCGLAKAIRTIHNLSTTRTPVQTTSLAAPSPTQEKKSGWHHDLKPENILYFGSLSFGSVDSKRGTFRIADFGAGKVHTYRSGSVNTKSSNGTLTYEPPEAISEGATSRPYDLWSLGCVFLELLIWAVFDSGRVKAFAKERIDRRYPGSMTNTLEDDGFWQMAEDGGVSLREPVNKMIGLLREEVLQSKWQHFKEVLDLVSRMLDPDRRNRILALDLWDTLDRIYMQTSVDLKRTSGSSLPASTHEQPSSPLPQLSLEAPDRRPPVPPFSTSATPIDTYGSNRQAGYISGDLTSSPT